MELNPDPALPLIPFLDVPLTSIGENEGPHNTADTNPQSSPLKCLNYIEKDMQIGSCNE